MRRGQKKKKEVEIRSKFKGKRKLVRGVKVGQVRKNRSE